MIGNSKLFLDKIIAAVGKTHRPITITDSQIIPFDPRGGDQPQNLDSLASESYSLIWYMLKRDYIVRYEEIPGYYQLTYKALYQHDFRAEHIREVLLESVCVPIVVTLMTEFVLHVLGVQ